MGNNLDYVSQCHCLEIFQMAAQGKGDKIQAMSRDLASHTINLSVLRRIRETPLTQEDDDVLAEVFRQIDSNQNSALSREELKAYFHKHHNVLRPDELEEIMDIVDEDKNGSIDADEFRTLATKLLVMAKSKF